MQANEQDRRSGVAWQDVLSAGVGRGTLTDAVTIAASICGTSSAQVSVLSSEEQWVAATVGTAVQPIPLDVAFCAHTVAQDGPLVVPDARLDPRFVNNPLVTGPPGIRFYAGTALCSPDGERVGALCVSDSVPLLLAPAQVDALVALGRQVSTYWALTRDAQSAREGFVSLADAAAMRNEFVDLVSHHLRTPLTSIRTFLELLADGTDLDPELAVRALEIVRTNSDQLLRLVDNLFVMAEATQLEPALHHEDVDLAVLVHRAARAVSAVAIRKGLRISVQAPAAVHVSGDAERLAHALEHLAFNAVWFTDRGGRIELRVRRDPSPVVEVSDTGIGIEPERQPRLVDPLACLGYDTDDVADQCVGLAAVNAVVYAHHGTLDVESRPGRGTTFRLTLPVRTGVAGRAESRRSVRRAEFGLPVGEH